MNKQQSAQHILITRPTPKGQALVELLQQQQLSASAVNLFHYQASADFIARQNLLTANANSIIIFISVPAVEYANLAYPIKHWQYDKIFAVGKATLHALKNLGISALSSPEQDSEGLLQLPELQNVANKNVVIIRGDEGRELLASELTHRGAKVTYCQSYFCQWRKLSQQELIDLTQLNITCIVNTSVALLENMLDLLTANSPENSQQENKYLLPVQYWQEQCVWIVASARIAERAKQLGLKKIVNAQGADNQCLLKAIIAMEEYNDRSQA